MVISPCAFFIVPSRWTSVQSGLGATPPQLPECRSRFAPRARSSNDATPRTPNVTRQAGFVHRPVGGDHEVGLEHVAVLAHELGDVRAADLLLALQQDHDVARQLAMHREMRLDRQDLGEVLALVVADAARVDPAIADRRLEGRADPGLQRVRRLHVVVAVEQHGGRAGLLLPPRSTIG